MVVELKKKPLVVKENKFIKNHNNQKYLSLIQRYLAGLNTFSDEKILAADVDGDGEVTIYDVTLIQQYLIGYIDCFPVEE